jgi:hypothetical protein
MLPLFAAVLAAPAAAQVEIEEDDQLFSGFIEKGPLTGNLDKLLNVNLFVATRLSFIENEGVSTAYGRDDADNVGVPGARLFLTGQAYTDLFYKVAYEFSNENDLDRTDRNGRLTDALLTWRMPVKTDMINRLDFNMGLTPIFLSPAGEVDLFFLDTIQQPLIVQNILPPGTARDKGLYFKGSFLDRDIIQVYAGMFNGTHRRIGAIGTAPISPGVDAWGNLNGRDTDQFAFMGRTQVNILNEEDYFFMVSGGVSRTEVRDVINNRRIDDTLFDIATEYRFNQRRTWVKAEFIRTRTQHADDMYGMFVMAGHRVAFVSENLEAVVRVDTQKLDDKQSSIDDLWGLTLGANWFFDPDHQHDGKFMVNYVYLDPPNTGLARPFDTEQALLFQFVIGF